MTAKRKSGRAAKSAAPAKAPAKKARGSRKAVHSMPREDVFVQEYLVDLNGRQAAIRAGYSPASARQTASEMLARPDVQAKVQAAMDERAARTGIDQDAVLKRLWAIATADPRELIELHRTCCRYCWGKDHKFQRTPAEMERDRAEHRQKAAEARAEGKPIRAFSEAGGTGWDPRKDPHPDCPECFGRGEEQVVPKDTRDLSPAAKLLYAGVKTTQHGLEIKMHDQTGMLVNVGKHLGLFKDRVELTGRNGGPVEHRDVGDILAEIDGAGTGLPNHADRDG